MKLIAIPLLVLLVMFAAWAGEDPRYCGPPARDADGRIERSRAVLRDFARLYPCPATGKPSPSCPGWAINHVVPLHACGCDQISNLQWLPNVLKSGPGRLPVDRWERKVYKCPGQAPEIVEMPLRGRLEVVE